MAKSRAWVIGFLRGSVAGYRRGTVPMRRVTASVLMAIEHGVPPGELLPLLETHGLRWSAAADAVPSAHPAVDAAVMDSQEEPAFDDRIELRRGSPGVSKAHDAATLADRRRQLHDILMAERRRLPLFPRCVRDGVQTHIAFLEQLIEETTQDLNRALQHRGEQDSSTSAAAR
jgi:hypothetical protein